MFKTRSSLAMIPEMSKSAYEFENTTQYRSHLKKTMAYLKDKIFSYHYVLDIGAKNPLTDAIENQLSQKICNTDGDLDGNFIMPIRIYGVIIYSHTIEHQFNPLHTLERLKPVMDLHTRLYILLPERGKLLWCKGHFHEIDEYRMGLLLERAGMQIISKTKQKIWRDWWFYLTGIKPLMRLFFEYHAIYEVKLKN